MSFNTISFSKLLEVTARDLNNIKESIRILLVEDDLTEEEKQCLISDAFVEIEHWSRYYRQYKEILDHEVEQLKEENIMLKERLNMMDKVLETRDANSNMVQIDLVELIEKLENITDSYKSAMKAAEHKAAMKEFNKRVASGEVKPAKRADVDDNYIIDMYNKGISAYKIAQSVGMTQQAILYRIKKLKADGIIA